MSIKILVPAEIPADEEVLVVEVLKLDGDEVITGDIICIIETSKTTYEIESTANGVVEHQLTVGMETKSGEILASVKVR